VNSFLDTLKQLGPSRLGIMGAILVGLLLFFVFVSMRVSSPDMKLLYANLETTDAGAIAAKLEESNIKYDVSNDGSRVMVPSTEVGRARMLLAEAGLPNGGSMGYEIFDKQSGFGTTNFVQNINQLRALEGELSRTINSLENIKTSRVHLVLPERELFSRERKPASASVFLGMNGNTAISREQIAAIQSLVSSAVPDLKPANVSIIDSNGNLLARGGDEEISMLNVKTEEMRRDYETRLTAKIEDQLGRIMGFGKVRATVNAEMNFDRISTNEEVFNPEGQVVRSSQVTQENSLEREAPPEDVTVENNLPGIGDDLLSDAKPSAENSRNEEVTNFEISKTVRNTVREVGEVKKISVAVLVDGTYTTDDKGTPDDKTDDEKVYNARSQQELEQITALIKSAVGFDADRGDTVEVVNMQFASMEDDSEFTDDRLLFGFEKDKLLDLAQTVTIFIMIILILLLVLQPMLNRILSSSGPEIDEELEADLLSSRSANPALTGPDQNLPSQSQESAEDTLINIQGVEGKVKASTVKKVEEIIQNYPNETVAVLRSWMTQET
jgi:flagellar M-ring protein FliF